MNTFPRPRTLDEVLSSERIEHDFVENAMRHQALGDDFQAEAARKRWRRVIGHWAIVFLVLSAGMTLILWSCK